MNTQTPTPTNVHQRINARASVAESVDFCRQICPSIEAVKLAAVTVIIEADNLWQWAIQHQYRDYCEDRNIWYNAIPDGPRWAFLRRFKESTRQAAQNITDQYIIFA